MNIHGSDSLVVAVDDQGNTGYGGSQRVEKRSVIRIASVNDSPVISAPGPQIAREDESLRISGLDFVDDDSEAFELHLQVRQNT